MDAALLKKRALRKQNLVNIKTVTVSRDMLESMYKMCKDKDYSVLEYALTALILSCQNQKSLT
jgi:hypothetical protein